MAGFATPFLSPPDTSLQRLRLSQVNSDLRNITRYKKAEILSQKKVQKRRQVVLTQDVPHLGKTGELQFVKNGYFRNYLLPFGKAKIATAEFLREIKLEEEKKEAEKRKIKEEAESVASMLRSYGIFNVRRKSATGNRIFGSVTSQDVVDIIKAQTTKELDKRNVTLPEIREIGEYFSDIKLHPEVTARVRLNVIPN